MGNEDYLTTHYVWVLQNEANWYHKAQDAFNNRDFGRFRRLCGSYISNVRKQNDNEVLSTKQVAFIVLELWTQMGGSIDAWKSDPGPLLDAFNALYKNHLRERMFALEEEVRSSLDFDPSNNGRIYSADDLRIMVMMHNNGASVYEIAKALKRTTLGIAEKLKSLEYVKKTETGDYMRILPLSYSSDSSDSSNQSPKEQTMNIETNQNVAIEVRTIIFGRDANSMSDQELIEAIKRVEGQISSLKEVKTSSKKIASSIKELEKQLEGIVEVLDAR